MIEDSRCPINVRCVWAGRLVVRSRGDAAAAGGETRDLELGQPQPVADGALTLVAAEPAKLAGAETDPRAYRFTFAFPGRALGVRPPTPQWISSIAVPSARSNSSSLMLVAQVGQQRAAEAGDHAGVLGQLAAGLGAA